MYRFTAHAAAGLTVTAVICEVANLASRAYGIPAGAAVIAVVVATCWITCRVRPLLHPVPARRSSRQADPQPATPASTQPPARLAA